MESHATSIHVVDAHDYALDAESNSHLLIPQPLNLEIDRRGNVSRLSYRPIVAINAEAGSVHSKNTISDGGRPTTEESFSDEDDAKKKAVVHTPHVVNDFKDFIQSSKELEKNLENFTHTVQKLGSALGLSIASHEVQTSLRRVREYFENHAQTLGVLLHKVKTGKSPKQSKRKKKLGKKEAETEYGGELAITYQNELSDALDSLFLALEKFSIAIGDFEDYSDHEGDKALDDFQIEIRVLSESLAYFGSDGDTPELRRYVTARATAMRTHLDLMTVALKRFIDIGIPCISFAQKRAARMLLNAATVATFFAGVAATTIQYSVTLNSKRREIAVNTLWFSSLVLSIGSAITGMLAMTWRQAVFSSPKRSLPWYIQFWIRQGYLTLLIASVVAFLAGLVVFVFDTQHSVAFWVVTGFTAFCGIGLANVSVWFGRERWNFSKFRKQQRRYLGSGYLGSVKLTSSWWYWIRFHLVDQMRRRRLTLFSKSGSVSDTMYSGGRHTPEPLTFFDRVLSRLRRTAHLSARPDSRLHHHHMKNSEAETEKRPTPWRGATATSRKARMGSEPLMRPSVRNTLDPAYTAEYIKDVMNLGASRSAKTTRIKHLQFSPNGKWLVVCYRYECSVFAVEDSFAHHQNLNHYTKKAKQVEWSPDGNRLLTRTKNAVKLWSIIDSQDNEFVCDRVFSLREDLDDIQWLNNEEFLVLADDSSSLFRIHISGSITGNVLPKDLTIHEMYSMAGSELVLFVATREIEGLPKDRAIDCIIVYTMDLDTSSQFSRSSVSISESVVWKLGNIKRKIPLLQDVESLTFGSDRHHLLVSYEGKPPEIWTVDEITGLVSMASELFVPREKSDNDCAWGDAFFIGPNEDIITCIEDDTMHFWRLETREHFHSFSTASDGEEIDELPVISWNPMSKYPMMATAGKTLPLTIWSPTKAKDDEKKDSTILLTDAQFTETPLEMHNINDLLPRSPPVSPGVPQTSHD